MHKTANVLNKQPKSLQHKAKAMLAELYNSGTRAQVLKAFDLFLATFGARHPKVTECLAKDRDQLLAFYDFPAEHWLHLCTTNPIESTCPTVRLRATRTKASGSRIACLTMVFKLVLGPEHKWRKQSGHACFGDVIQGEQFKDGIKAAA